MYLINLLLRYLDLQKIKLKKKLLWKLDRAYRSNEHDLITAQTKQNEYRSKNQEEADPQEEFGQASNLLKRFFPLLVCTTDLLVGFLILKSIAEMYTSSPLIVSFFIALIIVGIEICLGTFLEKMKYDLPEKEMHKSFDGVKYILCVLLAYLIVLTIPGLSLSEYFAQLGIYKTQVSLGIMSTDTYYESVFGLQLKYLFLGMLSLISHTYVLFANKPTILAFSNLLYKKKISLWRAKEDLLLKKKKELELIMVEKIVDFSEHLKIHIKRFGRHARLPNTVFSDYIVKLLDKIDRQGAL